MKSFPIHQPFHITTPASFHVFNKDLVEPPPTLKAIEDHANGVEPEDSDEVNSAADEAEMKKVVYDPADADHTFCVKVMLMSVPPAEELFQKTCHSVDGSKFFGFSFVLPFTS